MNLYLIRHGRSIANEQQLVTGSVSDVLSQEGVMQVEELKAWLINIEIMSNRFITSQWKRAQQTAHILWPNATWEINKEIGETDAGNVSEWKLRDFLTHYPDFYELPSNCYPGGESHNQLNLRTIKWLEKLLDSSNMNDDVTLVAHSGPISCLLQHAVDVSMDNFPVFVPSNASLSIISFPDNNIKNATIKGFSLAPDALISSYMR